MTSIKSKKTTDSPLRAAILAALFTFILSALVFFIWQDKHEKGHEPQHPTSREDKEAQSQSEKDLYTCGMHPWIISEEPGNCPICGMDLTPKTTPNDASNNDQGKDERKIVYWRAAMDATEIYDKPGKSRMGMDLVPVFEDEVIGGVKVTIDPTTQQNMGIRTKQVERGSLIRTIRTYGHITYDETQTFKYAPKFSGWIEKLYIDYTGQAVKKGDKLFEVYSPELVTAQEEYLAAYRITKNSSNAQGKDLLQAAIRRLAYWDVPIDQIAAIQASNTPKKTITIRSPYSGIVIKKNIDTGVFIKAGTPVFQISDLSHVWLEAHIFEYELPLIEVGQVASMTLPYTPGAIYHGRVAFIYPYLEKQARDVVLRLEFDNPQMDLKPDMYADVIIEADPGQTGIIIPSEAVIHSGSRNLVFISIGNGKFMPRDVTLGLPLNNNRVQVLTGLAGNETLVTSGQFLIDSESKLNEAVQKMLAARKAPPQKEATSAPEDDFFSDMDDNAPAVPDDGVHQQ